MTCRNPWAVAPFGSGRPDVGSSLDICCVGASPVDVGGESIVAPACEVAGLGPPTEVELPCAGGRDPPVPSSWPEPVDGWKRSGAEALAAWAAADRPMAPSAKQAASNAVNSIAADTVRRTVRAIGHWPIGSHRSTADAASIPLPDIPASRRIGLAPGTRRLSKGGPGAGLLTGISPQTLLSDRRGRDQELIGKSFLLFDEQLPERRPLGAESRCSETISAPRPRIVSPIDACGSHISNVGWRRRSGVYAVAVLPSWRVDCMVQGRGPPASAGTRS